MRQLRAASATFAIAVGIGQASEAQCPTPPQSLSQHIRLVVEGRVAPSARPCGTATQDDLDRVIVGLSRRDVLSLLRRPASCGRHSDGSGWLLYRTYVGDKLVGAGTIIELGVDDRVKRAVFVSH